MLILWPPAYRAIIDKLWISAGQISLIGQWAQLQTVGDFISAPAFLGVGFGLTVLIAQKDEKFHFTLLLASCIIGFTISATMLVGVIFFANEITRFLGLDQSFRTSLLLSSLTGMMSITSGQLCSYWLGKNQRFKILSFTLISGIFSIFLLDHAITLNANFSIQRALLYGAIFSILVNLGILFYLAINIKQQKLNFYYFRKALLDLIKYIPAGFSIGILTPLSLLVSRSLIAQNLDWQAAGTVTAIWRASDWILNCAQGFLYYSLLPQLSSQHLPKKSWLIIQRTMYIVLLPALIAFLLLHIYRDPILALLYSEKIQVSWETSALFWSGDLVRIFSGIFLIGLYAYQASKSISIGEFLSQPLFVFFLFITSTYTLELIGLYHLITYMIYASFCMFAFYFISRNK